MAEGRGADVRSAAFSVRAGAARLTGVWRRGARGLVTRLSGRARVNLRVGLSRVADRALLTDVRSRAAVRAVELETVRVPWLRPSDLSLTAE